ncbi:hypothetical protein M9H77_21405 [Catharanthus roseus]|uniref:Uncharacterized protein n=1 Tax=Catharanthus roseus TaxID=4058 RepID=A0ACC0AM71_CATRO|nr:hypothetical protein M9H77_21405 [Catharanthus roseus]
MALDENAGRGELSGTLSWSDFGSKRKKCIDIPRLTMMPSKIRNYRKNLNYYKLQIGPPFSSYSELVLVLHLKAAHRRSLESAGDCEQEEKKRTREEAYLNRGCELSSEDPRSKREWLAAARIPVQ